MQGKKDSLVAFELIEAKTHRDPKHGLEGLMSPLVGREWECKVMRKAIAATKLGRSALILVSGDAGVGKSRLLEEIRSCESEGFTWLEGRCFASTQTLSYAPILDLLRRHIGIADTQNVEEQQAALHAHVANNFSADPQVYSVLAQLLALPLTEAEAELIKGLKGEEFRARFFTIVEEELLALAEQQPIVLVIDDLHWADESSIDLLASVLLLVKRTRLTCISVSRSREEPASLWNKLAFTLEECRDYLVEVPLQSLSIDQSRTLMEGLLGGDYLPEPLAAEILDKSEGNPFFLEEVVRSLVESGGLALDNGKWTLTAPVGILRIPDTLQGVLLARLDRLSEELKQLTQKAAVIGRVFLYRILERLAPAGNSLREQLASLELSGLVRERCRLPELEFIFKHALTQEAAYQTLLTPARQALHRQSGRCFGIDFSRSPRRVRRRACLSFFLSQSWQKALEYLIRSGDAAFLVCAYPEARGHYGRALECLKHLDGDERHLHQKVEITIHLVGSSLQAEMPEKNLALLLEAEKIAQSLNDRVKVARVQLWIGRAHYYGGKLKEAAGYYRKVLLVAPQLEDPELAYLPDAVMGRVLFMQGQFKESWQMLRPGNTASRARKNRRTKSSLPTSFAPWRRLVLATTPPGSLA